MSNTNKETNETKCYSAHKAKNKSCKNTNCRYWHDITKNNNCVINKIKESENITLQEVGDLFGITRMRVCQIEKQILEKIKNNLLFS